MPKPRVTVVIPTLHAGEKLARCLDALKVQTCQDFDTVVVDNSGRGAAASFAEPPNVRVLVNARNEGFGAAINQGIEASSAEFILTLNDDAYPSPQWIERLVAACLSADKIGMCASQIRLDPDRLDSAGLEIYGDGTTKQRGHGAPPEQFDEPGEVLLPSGCAALYRRSMLDAIGSFDPDYFLYGEDADLGLRARLVGWQCVYVPEAVVRHDYSSSAGRASSLKAYYVERNRLYTVIKVFPALVWPLVPCYSLWRYLAHLEGLRTGRGLTGEYGRQEKWWRLVLIVGSAYWSALRCLPDLLEKRRLVRRSAVLGGWAFWKLVRRHYAPAGRIVSQ